MKTTLPMSAARRAWQITSAVQKRRNHDQLLPSRQFFRSLLEQDADSTQSHPALDLTHSWVPSP
jgi:hypothetical protein